MHHYRAFHLNISSAIPLPELQPGLSSADPDLEIRLGTLDSPKTPTNETSFWWNHESAYFYWPQAGTFLVRQGHSITVDPAPEAHKSLWRLPLLGGVLAMALHQRGLLVLHASAVSIDGKAVAFIGEKGKGKSTTAAALFHRGHPLLSDDIVAIDLARPGRPLVLPGFPQFKLWPDAVVSLGDDLNDLPRIHGECEKRVRSAHEAFASESIPLSQIFVLGEGTHLRIVPLSPQNILKQLLTHSYCCRYGRAMMNEKAGADHFRRCLQVAQNATVTSLESPRSFSLIGDLANLIESTVGLRPKAEDYSQRGTMISIGA
jgi:hypothetical protein